jgi:hypothetical protein
VYVLKINGPFIIPTFTRAHRNKKAILNYNPSPHKSLMQPWQ